MLMPEKLEITGRNVLWSGEDREALLGLLLENMAADCAPIRAVTADGPKRPPP